MFRKPFHVKSQTAIKGSDRKKLRHELSKVFPEDKLSKIVPNKEEMTVVKIYTHAGDIATVYNLMKTPVLFEIDKSFYPSVYLLWKFSNLLPVFTTWPAVFKKLEGGADLMLPGVVVEGDLTTNLFSGIKKYDPCCINLFGQQAPVAVGKTLLSGSDMFHSGMKGKGVRILHLLGDELWAFGDKSGPPCGNVLDGAKKTENESTSCQEHETTAETVSHLAENLSIGEEIEGVAFQTEQEESAGMAEQLDEDGICSRESMDQQLVHCFMCALKVKLKKSDLPLLTSSFYRNFMMPFGPKRSHLEIKKSSFKKLSKFLQAMEAKGYIVINEISKGVDTITEFDKSHPEFKDLIVPDLPKEEENGEAAYEAEYQPPEIVNLYSITAAVLPLFKEVGYIKGNSLSASEVKAAVTEYMRRHELQHKTNKSLVELNPTMARILLKSDENDLVTLPWKDVILRLQSKMMAAHQLTFARQEPVVRKGCIEPIILDVKQRASSKRVTLVYNLESYGINPEKFAHEIQIGVACSASVVQSKNKKLGLHVMAQGNQVYYVGNLLLDKFKIPRKYIDGLEKAPKSKRT